jgi:hypothetical protein
MNNIIEGVRLSEMCDYSFGDQSSVICGVYGGYMKSANMSNIEFINRLNNISVERNYMTLFIDNIRLYNRNIVLSNASDQQWVNNLMSDSDLLTLCSNFPNMNFIIFTNLEDTPIDFQIESKIPNNVLSIHAINAIYHNDKVVPFPYGVQRKLNPGDNRVDTLVKSMSVNFDTNNLLYVNHNINTNRVERSGIDELFVGKRWASVDSSRLGYDQFLAKIKNHKFMICPIGNAIDCHRNWEVLYLRRVPVMKKNNYLECLFKDFPVLFVEEYSDITEKLLIESNSIYQEALNMDMNKLNLVEIFNRIIKENIHGN